MALFNLESQHASFKAKIICPPLFLWGLEAIKKHARSNKKYQYMRRQFWVKLVCLQNI